MPAEPIPPDDGDEDLTNFDPGAEGGGDPCEGCGGWQPPWRYSRFCEACLWADAGAL